MFLSVKQIFATAAVLGGGLVASSVASAATLNIVGCDSFSGDISTGTITCVTSTTPPSPTAPSGCSATATPSAFATAAGGQVQLSASCTGGAAVATQTWTRTRSGVVTPVTAPNTAPDNSNGAASAVYTYTARLCAADGTSCTNATTGTVTVPAGVAPPPTASSCGSMSIVTPTLEGGSSSAGLAFTGQRWLTDGFNGGNVVVGSFQVPAGAAGTSTLQVYEYVDVKTARRMWVSRTRCDMSQTSGPSYSYGNTPSIYLRIGGTPSATEMLVQPGETLYLMVKNETSLFGRTTPSCSTTAGSHCNVGITLHTIQ